MSRDPRSPMDPQSKKALDEDIRRVEDLGEKNNVKIEQFIELMRLIINKKQNQSFI